MSKKKWTPRDKRFVAFIDILGFKDLVMRESHEDIYAKLLSLADTKHFIESIEKDESTKSKIGDSEIYTVSFSDSIVLFSKDDNPKSLIHFLVSVRWIFARAIGYDIPLKGAMAHGTITLNKSEQIYFGQPIIDAYLMEEDVNYLGVVGHYSIDAFIRDNLESLDKKYLDTLVFTYPTPLKCGNIVHTNVNWFSRLLPPEDRDKEERKNVLKKIESFRFRASGSPRRYIENTLTVYNGESDWSSFSV